MVVLIGCNGSMGKRYQAILKSLEKPFLGFDIEDVRYDVLRHCISSRIEGIILCTPTDTHAEWINDLITVGCKKILCEKPITKDLNELFEVMERSRQKDVDLKMVMQYTFPKLLRDVGEGDSYYDYFRHGNDGLVWDCFQIIALARGEVSLREESPVWQCEINGQPLSLAMMDHAYVWFIKQWLSNKLKQKPDDIMKMHHKVYAMAQGGFSGKGEGLSRHSS